jgi:hypothetical protein
VALYGHLFVKEQFTILHGIVNLKLSVSNTRLPPPPTFRDKKVNNKNVKERDHSEDLGVDGRILQRILEKYIGKLFVGFIWLRRGTSGGLL